MLMFLKLICKFTAITIQIPNADYLFIVPQFGADLQAQMHLLTCA